MVIFTGSFCSFGSDRFFQVISGSYFFNPHFQSILMFLTRFFPSSRHYLSRSSSGSSRSRHATVNSRPSARVRSTVSLVPASGTEEEAKRH